jgi:hypothetical protein
MVEERKGKESVSPAARHEKKLPACTSHAQRAAPSRLGSLANWRQWEGASIAVAVSSLQYGRPVCRARQSYRVLHGTVLIWGMSSLAGLELSSYESYDTFRPGSGKGVLTPEQMAGYVFISSGIIIVVWQTVKVAMLTCLLFGSRRPPFQSINVAALTTDSGVNRISRGSAHIIRTGSMVLFMLGLLPPDWPACPPPHSTNSRENRRGLRHQRFLFGLETM